MLFLTPGRGRCLSTLVSLLELCQRATTPWNIRFEVAHPPAASRRDNIFLTEKWRDNFVPAVAVVRDNFFDLQKKRDNFGPRRTVRRDNIFLLEKTVG